MGIVRCSININFAFFMSIENHFNVSLYNSKVNWVNTMIIDVKVQVRFIQYELN